MTGDGLHNAFVSGFETGLALRCDMDTAQAEHEARHATVRPIIAAMVSDMQRIRAIDLQTRADQRRARQVEACEDFKSKVDPWLAEDPNPSARVLNGWPDLRRAS